MIRLWLEERLLSQEADKGVAIKGGIFFCRVIFMMGVAIFSDVFCPVKGRGKYSYSGHAFWVKRFLATLENPSSLVCF
jgi:hypothetical protein